MLNDTQLLHDYVMRQSDEAFEALVERHVNLVYSVARRQVGDPHSAEEVTQAVFVLLARKAKSLGPGTILSGWLHRATRYVAAGARRTQRRRQQREQEAYMQTMLNEGATQDAWKEMVPVLDELLGRLRASDRDALVLRYFENKSLEEVGLALGLHERAAQKRVARGLARLRGLFRKQGMALSTATLAEAVSAHAVQAAPAGLSAASAAAAKGTVAAASITGLAEGGAKLMAWATLKTGLLAGLAVLVPVLCATVALPRLARHTPPTPALTEVAAFSLFTNAPDRFRQGSYGYVISGTNAVDAHNAPDYSARAEWFVPAVAGELSTIEIALQRDQPGGVNVFVARDVAGRVGKVLERFGDVLAPPMPPGGNDGERPTLILTSKLRPRLEAGSRYWLGVEPADPGTRTHWWPTWFPITDDYLDAAHPGKWRFQPAGPQRPALQVPLKRDYAKGAFAITVRVQKDGSASAPARGGAS